MLKPVISNGLSLSERLALKMMSKAISQLAATLKEMDQKLDVSKSDLAKRLAWPFTEQENQKYLDTLQRYNAAFNTILNSLGLY